MNNVDKILRTYMSKVATRITEDAKSKVKVKTGALRDSIRMIKSDGFAYLIGSDLEYSIYQELGTRNMPANSFLRKALYNKRNYR